MIKPKTPYVLKQQGRWYLLYLPYQMPLVLAANRLRYEIPMLIDIQVERNFSRIVFRINPVYDAKEVLDKVRQTAEDIYKQFISEEDDDDNF